MFATEQGHLETARLLLDRGADKGATNKVHRERKWDNGVVWLHIDMSRVRIKAIASAEGARCGFVILALAPVSPCLRGHPA